MRHSALPSSWAAPLTSWLRWRASCTALRCFDDRIKKNSSLPGHIKSMCFVPTLQFSDAQAAVPDFLNTSVYADLMSPCSVDQPVEGTAAVSSTEVNGLNAAQMNPPVEGTYLENDLIVEDSLPSNEWMLKRLGAEVAHERVETLLRLGVDSVKNDHCGRHFRPQLHLTRSLLTPIALRYASHKLSATLYTGAIGTRYTIHAR